MEHIISFLSTQQTGLANDDMKQFHMEELFHIELAGITYPDPNYVITRNKSRHYCLEYIVEGEGTVHVDETVFHPKKGDIYLLPRGRDHYYYSSHNNPWEKIWINYIGTLGDALLRTYKLEGIMHIRNLDIQHLFRKLLAICESKELDRDEILCSCSLVFHEIISNISRHVHKHSTLTRTSAAYEMKEFIDRHIYDKLTICDIANAVCLSESQATRVFKKELSETPYQYILTQKIETAKLLLLNTNMTIKQIALKLNFSDEHYFSNIFKEKTGHAPRRFSKLS